MRQHIKTVVGRYKGRVKQWDVVTGKLRRTLPQPDGGVKAFSDPRPEMGYSADMLMTLGGNAQITDDGPVLGNNKVKIGTPIEVEGLTYRFNASIVEVRIPQ